MDQGDFPEDIIGEILRWVLTSGREQSLVEVVGFFLSINLEEVNSTLKVFYPKAPRSAASIDPSQLLRLCAARAQRILQY